MLLTEKFHSICCLQIHPILFSVPNDMTPIFCLGLCACFPWEGAYCYLRNNFYCGEMPGVSTCCCPVYRTLGDSPSPLRETTQSPALEAVPAYCQKSGSLPTHPSCSHVRGAPFPSPIISSILAMCRHFLGTSFWSGPVLNVNPFWVLWSPRRSFSCIIWIVYLSSKPLFVIIWPLNFKN